MRIAGRSLHAGASTYVIAELSANHNQRFEQAVEIIGAAKQAGVAILLARAVGKRQQPGH
jgi:pseudaminic acid synthase